MSKYTPTQQRILGLLTIRPRTIAELAAELYGGCKGPTELNCVHVHLYLLRKRGVKIEKTRNEKKLAKTAFSYIYLGAG